MPATSLIITAPALQATQRSEAEIFGSVVWLWLHSKTHQQMPLHLLSGVLLPVLKARQFILASALDGPQERPVAFMAWANLSAEAESRYLHNANVALRPEDWQSGDRMWITDWFTPFGHASEFRQVVGQLLDQSCLRSLYHRGHERGMRVLSFRGNRVSKEQERQWWQERPMLALQSHVAVDASSHIDTSASAKDTAS
jgi:cytolysin-activating lysine-acyltransferase